jgi:putative transposase
MQPYWQLYYHLVWSTRDRAPRLDEAHAPILYGYIRARTQALGGTVFALGGLADHVHLVVAVPPRLAVATFVGQVKSSSSARFNRAFPDAPRFVWQKSYGVFSFDRNRLANAVDYVHHQVNHHAQGSTIPLLERTEGGAPQVIRNPETNYYIDSERWRAELLALDTQLFRPEI